MTKWSLFFLLPKPKEICSVSNQRWHSRCCCFCCDWGNFGFVQREEEERDASFASWEENWIKSPKCKDILKTNETNFDSDYITTLAKKEEVICWIPYITPRLCSGGSKDREKEGGKRGVLRRPPILSRLSPGATYLKGEMRGGGGRQLFFLPFISAQRHKSKRLAFFLASLSHHVCDGKNAPEKNGFFLLFSKETGGKWKCGCNLLSCHSPFFSLRRWPENIIRNGSLGGTLAKKGESMEWDYQLCINVDNVFM